MGGIIISVTAPDRDWQSLARKLGNGVALTTAAEQCGIPIEEARAWAKEELSASEYDVINLHRIADTAIEDAFHVLRRIAHEPTPTITLAKHDDDDGAVSKQLVQSQLALDARKINLDAAKALAKLALDARKISGGGSTRGDGARKLASASVQLDLFDVRGPWKLTDPNAT